MSRSRRSVDDRSQRQKPVFAVVSAAGFALLAFLYMSVGALHLPKGPDFLVGDLAFLLPLLLSVLLGVVAFRRASGAEKRFWLFFVCTAATLLVSESYYVWWVLSNGQPPPPVYAPFQVFHLSAAVFFFGMILTMTRFSAATPTQQARYALDLSAGTVVLYVVVLQAVVRPMFAPIAHSTATDALVGAAYPVWAAIVVVAMVWMAFGLKRTAWKPWERFIALSVIIYAVGIGTWPLWYVSFMTNGPSLERGILDLTLVLGDYLLVVATAYRLTRRDQAWLPRPTLPRVPTTRPSSYIIPVLTFVWMPIAVVLTFRSAAGSLDRVVFGASAAAVAVIAVARTVVVAVENGGLFRRTVTDPLTGLYNHRFFHERLRTEMEVARRYDEPLSIIAMDIDDFAEVNATRGHPEGDTALGAVADAVRHACRDSDMVCRVGGDEFTIILPNTGCDEALTTSARIRMRVSEITAVEGWSATLSQGIACFPAHADSAEELVRMADSASYWVKYHGKDQALIFDPIVVGEMDPEERVRHVEEETHLSTVSALARAVDARSPETRFHSRNVAALAVRVARELGMDAERTRVLDTAAQLHDIGMIGLPDDILDKPGPLDAGQTARVHAHPELGERILGATMLSQILPWIRHHHERWDGGGYPDGKRAVAIPLESRIIFVCGAYEAMTAGRPYRAAMTPQEAVAELVAGAGTQFDPSVVDVFLRTLEEPVGEQGRVT
jgi:diguanylate cyclase (GGDEF)-like protein